MVVIFLEICNLIENMLPGHVRTTFLCNSYLTTHRNCYCEEIFVWLGFFFSISFLEDVSLEYFIKIKKGEMEKSSFCCVLVCPCGLFCVLYF